MTTTSLPVSHSFALPLDAATRRLAILAMSGAGKSNAAVVLAEQMFVAGIPWVAIDPKGDWWGIRSNASGKGPGLPIPIFGGLHGDLPLGKHSGAVIANLIIDKRLTCVLDISEFEDRQSMWQFLIDLGETLLKNNRSALHLFLEEADEYLPQRTVEKGNLPKCLGIWQRLIKRGRFRGIGSTQITQRSASLNKDTLYQAEALIAMRVTGPKDREAVRDWVDHHNAAKDIVASLPMLMDGEAWITSPAWLRTTVKVHFNRRTTFDSGKTPVQLDGSATPRATLADIDLDAVRAALDASVERTKQDDPVELRKRIKELEAREPERIEIKVPVLTDADRELIAAQREIYERVIAALGVTTLVLPEPGEFLAARQSRSVDVDFLDAHAARAARDGVSRSTAKAESFGEISGLSRSQAKRLAVQQGDPSLKTMPRRMLIALAQRGPLSRRKILIFTNYQNGGSTSRAFAELLRDGLVTTLGDGRLELSDKGRRALGSYEPLPKGKALQQKVLGELPTMERAILNCLLTAWPSEVTRGEVLERTGYQNGGSTSRAFAKLTAYEYITISGRGLVKAADEFFE